MAGKKEAIKKGKKIVGALTGDAAERARRRKLIAKRKAIAKNVAAKKEREAAASKKKKELDKLSKTGMSRAKALAQEGMATATTAGTKAGKKLNKLSKARTEADVAQLLKEGQRQYDPDSGMVFKKGGLIGPSYRHSRKDYRKGGLAKRMK